MGGAEGGGAVTDVREGDGARDNQTVDDVTKVQVILGEVWSADIYRRKQ